MGSVSLFLYLNHDVEGKSEVQLCGFFPSRTDRILYPHAMGIRRYMYSIALGEHE